MKAVRIHAYGGLEQLIYEEVPIPAPAGEEVLIRVRAAGVNPLDRAVRMGILQQTLPLSLPVIPGCDVAGTVEALGPQQSRFAVGDAVYAMLGMRMGGYAEYVAAASEGLARKPHTLTDVEAAAVPLAALTAWQALFPAAHLQSGQKVLIHAAAGGVGTFAVQLARWKGASVIATASAENHALLRELGADVLIDYKQTRFEDVAQEVDVVLDALGGDTQARSWQTLKPGGVLVALMGLSSTPPAERNLRSQTVFVQPDAEQLTEIAGLIEAGSVRPVVETVLPLREARQAHAVNESGRSRGKIVLQVLPDA